MLFPRIVVSGLCPLPSTFFPLTFPFQISPLIVTAINIAPLHNAPSVKRLQYYVMASEGSEEKFMLHVGTYVFNHCGVMGESFA